LSHLKNHQFLKMEVSTMFAKSVWDELGDFRRSFDQMFDNFYTSARRSSGQEGVFLPAVETGWTDDFVNLRVVLPGVHQEDLKLSIEGGHLVIQGERKAPKDFGKEGAVYNQLAYGKFERRMELPNGLDLDNLQANLHDGLLDIGIPVAAAVKPKQINITAGPEHKTLTSGGR
jgi:HSP20 family protein